MLNHIVIMGRLTRDPELRYTRPSQTPVASFTLAVDYDYVDSKGERGVDFIDCVAWRSTAEFVSKYFKKGSMAVVSGRLRMIYWVDRDGNKRRGTEVDVSSIYFAGSKPKDHAAQNEIKQEPEDEPAYEDPDMPPDDYAEEENEQEVET